MKEMHVFAGVNAPEGFVSRFSGIMPDAPGRRKIFIKGGPGMGKSTLMKKIARRAGDEGLSVELFHCSSDPASLDGVHIPALQTAIVDATAPHIADPVYPCVGGEIFDVSVHIRGEKLTEHYDDFTAYVKRKKQAFQKGYYFLAAALPLLRLRDAEYQEKTEVQGIYRAAEKLAERILRKTTGKEGRTRELFVSAITPDGFINYAESVFSDAYTVALKGKYGAALFARRFYELARMHGHDVVLFHCPMRPAEKIEHLYIPDVGFSLTTHDGYTAAPYAELFDLDAYGAYDAVEEGNSYAGALMQRAIDAFSEARTAHGFLEKLYMPAMDFERLEESGQALINSIF